jgi:hypothetical protein
VKKEFYSAAFSISATRVFVTTLLVLGILCLLGPPASGQGNQHFTILQEQIQNYAVLMGEIESLGLTDTEFAHSLENAMASALRLDGFTYYINLSRADTEFLKLDQSTQAAILDIFARLTVPVDSPMNPAMICVQCCALTCCGIWCTGDCWTACWYGYALCMGEGECRSLPTQSSTWGAIKAIYRAQDDQR